MFTTIRESPKAKARRIETWRRVYATVWRCISFARALGTRLRFTDALETGVKQLEKELCDRLRERGIDPAMVQQYRGAHSRKVGGAMKLTSSDPSVLIQVGSDLPSVHGI